MPKRYPSDLSDTQWAKVKPFFKRSREDGRGRPRSHEARELLNGILYVVNQGCSWRGQPGNRQDADGARVLLPVAKEPFPKLRTVLGDKAYQQRPLVAPEP